MVADGPHGLRKEDGHRGGGGAGSERARHLLPDRRRRWPRRGTSTCCAGSVWRSAVRRRAEGVARAARSGREHQAVAAVRPQLRVLLRGPAAGGRAGRRDGRRHPEPGCRHLAQALRGEQPGDRPAAGQRRRRRAHAAGDLPAGLRAGGHAGPAVDGDVLLQQGQRRLRLAAPLAAHRGAARRVGLRRPGRLGLGGGARPRPPPSPPGSTSRCRPPARAQRPGRGAPRCGTARSTRRCSTSPSSASALAGRATHWPERRRGRRPSTSTPTTPSPGRPRPSPRCCSRTTAGRSAARPASRAAARGRRRVRPDAPLPGRGQLHRSTPPGSTAPLDELPRGGAGTASRSPSRRASATAADPDGGGRRGSRTPTPSWRSSGCPASAESEGYDRDHMDLPADQVALLEAVAERQRPRRRGAGERVGGHHRAWEHHAAAVLECWLAGPGGRRRRGRPAARCGRARRGGSPRPSRCGFRTHSSYLDFPGDAGHVRYGEGIFVGYRAYDRLEPAVAYPFGHGLSYTTFGYDDLVVEVDRSPRGRRPARAGHLLRDQHRRSARCRGGAALRR